MHLQKIVVVRIVAIVVIITHLAACATQATNVRPQYVSATKYESMACAQLFDERAAISLRLEQLKVRINKAANADAGMVALLVVLVVVAPFFFFRFRGNGPDHTEYSRLLGEQNALQQQISTKGCSGGALTPVPSYSVAVPSVATPAGAAAPVSSSVPSGGVVTTAPVQKAGGYVDPRVLRIQQMLDSNDPNAVRNIAKSLFQVGERDQIVLDHVAARIEKSRYTTDRNEGDAIAWLCKVIGNSRDGRYKQFMSGLAATALEGKVKKYAEWATGRLPVGVEPQYFPPRITP